MRKPGVLLRFAAGGFAAAILLAIPTTAMAAPAPTVTPVVDCVRVQPDGSFTAVWGYTNSSNSTVTIPRGANNYMWPSNYDGKQPDTFAPGTVYGAYESAPMAQWSWSSWVIGNQEAFAWAPWYPACGPPAAMAQEGNGLGAPIAMLAAGTWGIFMVVRSRRKHKLAGAAS
jgi:hypothetical protein